MLKVIVNKYRGIKECSKGSMLITDADFYDFLNSEKTFNGQLYTDTRMEQLIDDIIDYSIEKDVVIHTFNALLLNFFKDEDAIKSFYYFDGTELKQFFGHPYTLNKLSILGCGEAVCDTDIEAFLKD